MVFGLRQVHAVRYAWPLGGDGDTCCPGADVAAGLSVCVPANCPILSAKSQVRKMMSWSRSLANFSLLQPHSHWNARANLHLLGQPDTLLASAPGQPFLRGGDGRREVQLRGAAEMRCLKPNLESLRRKFHTGKK
jgi:hypothetical protein